MEGREENEGREGKGEEGEGFHTGTSFSHFKSWSWLS